MAIKPITRYIGQVDAAAGYPYGKGRNANSYQDGTGTPFERDFINDSWGFNQALLVHAGITPNEVPDMVGASQYLEAVEAAARRGTAGRALALRALDAGGVTLPSPTVLTLGVAGALSPSGGKRVALAVGGGVNSGFAYLSTPHPQVAGASVPGMTAVRALVNGGARILAIGQDVLSAGQSAFSVNGGTSWGAGAAIGVASPHACVWDGTRFIVANGGGVSRHSTDGSAWTAPSGNDLEDVFPNGAGGGLAVLEPGHVISTGQAGTDRVIAETTDHGASWSVTATIGTTAEYAPAFVAGNGSGEVYWIGKSTATSLLDVFVSSDGAAWEKRAEVEGTTGTLRPHLLMCQDTGALVVAYDIGDSVEVSASLDRGRSWSPVVYYNLSSNESIALARGRVFAVMGSPTRLLASDELM